IACLQDCACHKRSSSSFACARSAYCDHVLDVSSSSALVLSDFNYSPDSSGFARLTRLRHSCRPDLPRGLGENLLLHCLRQSQRPEFLEILLDVGHAWPWPISSKECFRRYFFQPRKVLEQCLRRYAADIEIHIRMAPY